MTDNDQQFLFDLPPTDDEIALQKQIDILLENEKRTKNQLEMMNTIRQTVYSIERKLLRQMSKKDKEQLPALKGALKKMRRYILDKYKVYITGKLGGNKKWTKKPT